MKFDILLSSALHVIAVLLVVFSPPLHSKKQDLGEVIRVSLASPGDLPKSKPQPIAPLAVPQAVTEKSPDIPISTPTTIKKAANVPKKKTAKKETSTGTGETGPMEVAGTGEGTPFRGVSTDNANFVYPYWFRQTFNKISGNFRNPVVYDGTLVCTIYFQVIRSGRMIELSVLESSGFREFDDACLAAIQRSTPFPPLPGEFAEEIIGITVPFTNR
jgi:TonB family protein